MLITWGQSPKRRTLATRPQTLSPSRTCTSPPAARFEQRGRLSLQQFQSKWACLIFVTSKGSDVRVASVVEVRVKQSTRSRKNPGAHFTPSSSLPNSWDFQPAKKVELHRENLYIQLVEWYRLDYLKAKCIKLYLVQCSVWVTWCVWSDKIEQNMQDL